MDKGLAIIAVSAGIALMAAAASAGEYHYGDNLICSDCHTMHFSQQHGYDGTPGQGFPPFGSQGPYDYLLRDNPNELCKSCHDGQTFAPDVIGVNVGGYVREAGGMTTGQAPYEDWKGHTLGFTGTAPGGSSHFVRFACTNCHSHHGNTNFRNLNGDQPVISYAKGANDLTKDVFLRSWVKGQVSTNYSVDNVDFNEPNNRRSGMGKFCKGCHTDFHGASGDENMGGSGGQQWLRHPTADANIGGGHSSLTVFKNHPYRVKVMSPTGDWGTQGQTWSNAPNDLTPSCMSCHKAHGNQNAFGLIFMAGSGPVTEEGDAEGNGPNGGLRALCKQCHVQGG